MRPGRPVPTCQQSGGKGGKLLGLKDPPRGEDAGHTSASLKIQLNGGLTTCVKKKKLKKKEKFGLRAGIAHFWYGLKLKFTQGLHGCKNESSGVNKITACSVLLERTETLAGFFFFFFCIYFYYKTQASVCVLGGRGKKNKQKNTNKKTQHKHDRPGRVGAWIC